MNVPTFKWLFKRPAKQPDGSYPVVEEIEIWLPTEYGNPLRTLVEKLNTGSPVDGQTAEVRHWPNPTHEDPTSYYIPFADHPEVSCFAQLLELAIGYQIALPSLPGNEDAVFVHFDYSHPTGPIPEATDEV